MVAILEGELEGLEPIAKPLRHFSRGVQEDLPLLDSIRDTVDPLARSAQEVVETEPRHQSRFAVAATHLE